MKFMTFVVFRVLKNLWIHVNMDFFSQRFGVGCESDHIWVGSLEMDKVPDTYEIIFKNKYSDEFVEQIFQIDSWEKPDV